MKSIQQIEIEARSSTLAKCITELQHYARYRAWPDDDAGSKRCEWRAEVERLFARAAMKARRAVSRPTAKKRRGGKSKSVRQRKRRDA